MGIIKKTNILTFFLGSLYIAFITNIYLTGMLEEIVYLLLVIVPMMMLILGVYRYFFKKDMTRNLNHKNTLFILSIEILSFIVLFLVIYFYIKSFFV